MHLASVGGLGASRAAQQPGAADERYGRPQGGLTTMSMHTGYQQAG
jgi:hypothetical protein